MDTGAVLRAAARAAARFERVPDVVREELAQEAALRTWSARGVDRPEAYACKVAKHLALDWLRRPYERAWPAAEPLDELDLEERVGRGRVVDRILGLIRAAPPSHRAELAALLAEEPVRRPARQRDAGYQRRRRALAWLRTRLGSDAGQGWASMSGS